MRFVPSALFLLLLASTPAVGDTLGVSCDGDSLQVSMYVTNFYSEDTAGQYFVVQADYIGVCRSIENILPEPIALPPEGEIVHHVVRVPIIARDRFFKYRLYRMDADGNRYNVPSDDGDLLPWDVAACGNAIGARGYLYEFLGVVDIVLCPGHCWGAGLTFDFDHAKAGWEDYLDTGQLVNLYGEATVHVMGSYFEVSRVEPETSDDGCEAVGVREHSWGSLKALYR